MKKAIVVVSFGTSYIDSLEKSIKRVESQIAEYFQDYDVVRAFTSHRIIDKIEKRDGIRIYTPEEALDKLKDRNYEEIIIQPLHIIPGEEFHYLKKVVNKYNSKFKSLSLGRPILYYQGVKGYPEDYSLFIESIKPLFDRNVPTILIGHGTPNPANAAYGALQTVLQDEGYENIFVGTIEGYPKIENVIKRIKCKNIKEVKIVPILLVAGRHVMKDISSDKDNSWVSLLHKEGITSKVYIHGLGELDTFNALYIKRIEDLILGKYNQGEEKDKE